MLSRRGDNQLVSSSRFSELCQVSSAIVRIGMKRLLLSCVLLFSTSLMAQQAPRLRLPDTVIPTSYRVSLTIDPARDNFDGDITIAVKVKQAVNVIWLNASNLTIHDAELKTGEGQLRPDVIPGGTDFVGLRFSSVVPVGTGEIRIRYTGRCGQRIAPASSVWKRTET